MKRGRRRRSVGERKESSVRLVASRPCVHALASRKPGAGRRGCAAVSEAGTQARRYATITCIQDGPVGWHGSMARGNGHTTDSIFFFSSSSDNDTLVNNCRHFLLFHTSRILPAFLLPCLHFLGFVYWSTFSAVIVVVVAIIILTSFFPLTIFPLSKEVHVVKLHALLFLPCMLNMSSPKLPL